MSSSESPHAPLITEPRTTTNSTGPTEKSALSPTMIPLDSHLKSFSCESDRLSKEDDEVVYSKPFRQKPQKIGHSSRDDLAEISSRLTRRKHLQKRW